jgi:hypothetical protein
MTHTRYSGRNRRRSRVEMILKPASIVLNQGPFLDALKNTNVDAFSDQ